MQDGEILATASFYAIGIKIADPGRVDYFYAQQELYCTVTAGDYRFGPKKATTPTSSVD